MATAEMAGICFQQTLHCTEGGSDKEYRVTVTEGPAGFSVLAESRRRGDAWKSQGFKAQDAIQGAAMKVATSTLKSKTAKGYKVIATFSPEAGEAGGEAQAAPVAVAAATDATDTPYRPQLLNIVSEEVVERLLDDDGWIMQEKHDGRRHAVHQDAGADALGINKLGRAVPVNPGHATRLAKLFEKAGGFHVDGESVGETLYIFDLLQAGATEEEGDIRFLGYMDRMKRLERIAALTPEAFAEDSTLPGQIVVVETWEGREAKRAAYAALKARNAEGVVFKRRDSEFKAGRPSTGGDHLKFKFYATASFIVKGVNAKRSIALALLDEKGVTVGMGNCTVPPNKELPCCGQIAEIRYLYAFRGGKVYQPTFLCLRDDVEQAECVVGQLKYKASDCDED